MIITNSKPYGVVKGMLKKWKTIGIISCNSCARVCETGGQKRMDELAERLKKDGYNVVNTAVVPLACNIELVKRPQLDADILVVLACDCGVSTVQEIFANKKVVAANDTIGIGARDGQGNLYVMVKF
ncbi:MAG: hypothetical protein PVH73_10360 [Candidatus Bathyarchaeota archaeon]|jgi:hypothetical protein